MSIECQVSGVRELGGNERKMSREKEVHKYARRQDRKRSRLDGCKVRGYFEWMIDKDSQVDPFEEIKSMVGDLRSSRTLNRTKPIAIIFRDARYGTKEGDVRSWSIAKIQFSFTSQDTNG